MRHRRPAADGKKIVGDERGTTDQPAASAPSGLDFILRDLQLNEHLRESARAAELEHTGWIVLRRDGRVRRVPFWLRVTRPRLGREHARLRHHTPEAVVADLRHRY